MTSCHNEREWRGTCSANPRFARRPNGAPGVASGRVHPVFPHRSDEHAACSRDTLRPRDRSDCRSLCPGTDAASFVPSALVSVSRWPSFDGAEFDEYEIQLKPGDRLYFYSDGITEAVNSRNEMLNMEGLIRLIEHNQPSSSKEGLDKCVEDLKRWCDSVPLEDDISLLALEIPDVPLPTEVA